MTRTCARLRRTDPAPRLRPGSRAVRPAVLLTVLLAGLASGCGSREPTAGPDSGTGSESSSPSPTATPDRIPTPTGSPDVTPSPPAPTGDVDPALASVVAQARADLAARLDVPEDAITVVSAEVVTWPDAGLGCRQPGRFYAQVTTDGTRTVLEHAERRFAYHTGGRTTVPFYCPKPG